MSLDMLRIVCAVEEESREAVLSANKKAADEISEAHDKGEATIASTLERAKSEIDHLLRASDQKATSEAMELASSTANKLATQRARAEKRLDDAAHFICERIVNS